MFFDDAPVDMDFILLAGVPASAVPQYWHLAAGFEDMLIAHAESRHFVRFIREHGAAQPNWGRVINPNVKSAIFFIIFSLVGYYIKKSIMIKEKNNINT